MGSKRRTKADLEAEIAGLRASLAERSAEASVLARVREALPPRGEMSGFGAARAEIALTLAGELDGIARADVSDFKGPPPNVSAMAKELRACLDSLELELGDADSAGFFDGADVPASMGNS